MPSKLARGCLLVSVWCQACVGVEEISVANVFDDPTIPLWQLRGEPEWTIGDIDASAEYLLHGVRGAVILNDRVAVGDGGTREVRLFDSHGRFLDRSGGSGGGPGEYGSLGGLSPFGGDTIAVWDPQHRRMTLLEPDGGVVRTVSPQFTNSESNFPEWIGVLPDGRVLFRDPVPTSSLRDEPSGLRRDSIDFIFLEQDGVPGGIPHRVRGPELQVWHDVGESVHLWGTLPVLFGRSTFAAVSGGEVVIAYNDSLEFERLGPGGRVERRMTLPWEARPVSARDVEDERARFLEKERGGAGLRSSQVTINGESMSERMFSAKEVVIESLAHRDSAPSFSEIRGDRLGRTWIAAFPAGEEGERRWAILDCRFQPIGRMDLPAGHELLAVGADAIVVVSTDELGIETLKFFRFEEPEGKLPGVEGNEACTAPHGI